MFMRHRLSRRAFCRLAGLAGPLVLASRRAARADDLPWSHAIAMHGVPRYGPEFRHFAYADPAAPKGGVLGQAVVGSFDSLNPFTIIGNPAVGVRQYHFASLTARAWDEPFSLYPYVAEAIATPPDRRWVAFRLNPAARFHDGSPITLDDLLFSMEVLRDHGLPNFRRNYGRIAAIERLGDRAVRFTFNDEADRETPLLIGLMPILSRADFSGRPFDRASLDWLLGAGPYRIAAVDPGRRIVFRRVEDWWGAALPSFRGCNNFAELRFDYFRDAGVAFEAFKSGQHGFRLETSAERWATGYDFPARRDGRVTCVEIPHRRPSGMRGFALNTRRPLFADRRVRMALCHAFDFEWVNNTLWAGQYRRITSMFTNSPLAATGLPEGGERELLERYRGQLPPELFDRPFTLPTGDGSGNNRESLRRARDLLAAAGWVIRQGRLVQGETGQPFAFEFLLNDPGDERVALAYVDSLRRLGITATVRTVDSAQYLVRTESYDFDTVIGNWGVTLSPGAEQDFYWSCRAARIEGTRNYPGVRDPVVDALIAILADAQDPEDLVAAARALDRVLLWGYYVVPLTYLDRDLVAYWGNLGRVEDHRPLYGTLVETWWSRG